MGWFKRARSTRGTAGSANTFQVQAGQKRCAVATFDCESDSVGQPASFGTAKLHAFQRIKKLNKVHRQCVEILSGKNWRREKIFHCVSHPHDGRNILRPRPALIFMRSAEYDRLQMQRRLDEQRARDLWAMQLVR